MGGLEHRKQEEGSVLSHVLVALGLVFLFGGLVFGSLDFPDTLVITFVLWIPAAVLLGSGLQGVRRDRRSLLAPVDAKERELLGALREHGRLTPTSAAMETTLTVTEADRKLSELAQKGHLEVQVQEGGLAYGLWEPIHHNPERLPPESTETRPEGTVEGANGSVTDRVREPQIAQDQGTTQGAPHRTESDDHKVARQLDEPLSEREVEVLRLLATGRSNREIAGDLSVAMGTVKTHVNNLYRKLEVRNRTEALARARSLGLSD